MPVRRHLRGGRVLTPLPLRFIGTSHERFNSVYVTSFNPASLDWAAKSRMLQSDTLPLTKRIPGDDGKRRSQDGRFTFLLGELQNNAHKFSVVSNVQTVV
jgi:hypothetical protein